MREAGSGTRGFVESLFERNGLAPRVLMELGSNEAINPVPELAHIPSQSVTGRGCRPTRPWIFRRLIELLGFAYMPSTQPAHEDFPLDWTGSQPTEREARAVFIGSRRPLNNPLLLNQVPYLQTAN